MCAPILLDLISISFADSLGARMNRSRTRLGPSILPSAAATQMRTSRLTSTARGGCIGYGQTHMKTTTVWNGTSWWTSSSIVPATTPWTTARLHASSAKGPTPQKVATLRRVACRCASKGITWTRMELARSARKRGCSAIKSGSPLKT